MTEAITQDRALQSHPSSFESQGFRASVSKHLPNVADKKLTMHHDDKSGVDSLDEQIAILRPSISATELCSAQTDRSSKPHSEHTRGRQSGRSSLPMNYIGHLLSSESPNRDGEHHDNGVRRVLCSDCDEWIVTQDADGSIKNEWAEHSLNCSSHRVMRDASPSIAGDASTSISVTPAPTADSSEPKDTNTAFRRRKVKHYESERLALLEKDPQIDEIEEYRVLCAFCEKWIELRKDRPYCPIGWTAHKLQCVSRRRKSGLKPVPVTKKSKPDPLAGSAAPSEVPPASVQIRRTEEERVKFLVSDPRATTVEPHRILCAVCGRWIQLRKNSTYCTAPWVQHIRKCAARHNTSPRANGSNTVTYTLDPDGEDELESEDEVPPVQEVPEEVPQKRGRGRPRKRKFGQPKTGQPASFTLRPVSGASPSPPNNAQKNGRSASPSTLRTPSPPLNHPYSNDMYWYPSLPPMSSYYSLYAGSQYNESDDSYSLYFHAQPPTHQVGPSPGQGRFRAKSSKQMLPNSANSPNPAAWQAPTSMPLSTGSTIVRSTSTGPDGSSPQPGRAWIVWRLKNYSTNVCPLDPRMAPDSHASSAQRASSEASSSGSEHLPMFRSGTWPHLLDPQEPGPTQNLSPYVHPDATTGSKEAPAVPGTRSAHFGIPSAPPPHEDPGLISFNSSAHIPIRASDPFHSHSRPPLPPLPPLPHAPVSDPNIDPRFAVDPRPSGPVVPDPPQGADLDSSECRLAYTFKSIAFLFSTSFQGADDMSLEVLTSFMNRSVPRDKMYDGQEVSEHVAVLGERKQLVFTKEGGVQLLESPS